MQGCGVWQRVHKQIFCPELVYQRLRRFTR